MERTIDLLNIFEEESLRKKLNELISATEQISKKQPVYGFYPSFVVPGWIGFIQETIMESKMGKVANAPFLDGKTYYEFADWIIAQSKEVAELYERVKPETEEKAKMQSAAIIRVFEEITKTWTEYCPEISTYCNIKYTENTLISPVGLIYKGFQTNLKSLGFYMPKSGKNNKSSFKEDGKNFLYRIAGMIINVLILVSIIGIIGIFEALFDW